MIVTSTGFADWPAFMAGIRSLNNQTPIMNSWAGDGTFWYPKSPPVSNYWYVTYASVFGDDPSAQVKRLISQMTASRPAARDGQASSRARRSIDGIAAAIKRAKGSTKGAVLAAIMREVQGPAHDLGQGQLLADSCTACSGAPTA